MKLIIQVAQFRIIPAILRFNDIVHKVVDPVQLLLNKRVPPPDMLIQRIQKTVGYHASEDWPGCKAK